MNKQMHKMHAPRGAVAREASADARRPRVLLFNRSYWPDAEATGQLLTELCEDLAAAFDVTVVAGQPNQNPGKVKFRRRGRQLRNGVRILRVWNTRFPKRFLPGRAVNLLSYLAGAALAALRVQRPDIVVVETDPPLLCLLGAFLRWWYGAKLVVYLQDIYPDIAIALDKLPNGRMTQSLRKLMFGIYRRADRVVVLSRDMEQLLIRSGVAPRKISCIPNWVDTAHIVPQKRQNAFRAEHGLDGELVVMYSGNMGLCQRLDDVLAAADRLRDRSDVLFLLIGDGASRISLQQTARRLALPNVRFLPYQPRQHLAESLSAADLHLIPLDPRITSCLMPSKLYAVLASGSPLLAVAPDDCELAELTRRHDIGVVIPPSQPEVLADRIRLIADHPWDLEEMGRRARRVAEDRYDRRRMTRRFGGMLSRLLGPGAGPQLGRAPQPLPTKTYSPTKPARRILLRK